MAGLNRIKESLERPQEATMGKAPSAAETVANELEHKQSQIDKLNYEVQELRNELLTVYRANAAMRGY